MEWSDSLCGQAGVQRRQKPGDRQAEGCEAEGHPERNAALQMDIHTVTSSVLPTSHKEYAPQFRFGVFSKLLQCRQPELTAQWSIWPTLTERPATAERASEGPPASAMSSMEVSLTVSIKSAESGASAWAAAATRCRVDLLPPC